MNETKLKIMEMLDKEGLVDKEKKKGCIVRKFETNRELGKICFEGYKYYSMIDDSMVIFGIDEYRRPVATYIGDNCGIIGQYHLGHIIQWFWNNGFLQAQLLPNSFRMVTGGSYIIIPYKTPPMERSEKQDKELLEFMQTVLNSK